MAKRSLWGKDENEIYRMSQNQSEQQLIKHIANIHKIIEKQK